MEIITPNDKRDDLNMYEFKISSHITLPDKGKFFPVTILLLKAVQSVSQFLEQNDWAQIQDHKWYSKGIER